MTTRTLGAVESIGASKKDGQRAKNMFAARSCCRGCTAASWSTARRSSARSSPASPEVAEANVLALKAGWNYGETTEGFGTTYESPRPSSKA